jgi:hypothetical protein
MVHGKDSVDSDYEARERMTRSPLRRFATVSQDLTEMDSFPTLVHSRMDFEIYALPN